MGAIPMERAGAYPSLSANPLRGIASPWGLGPSPPPFGLGPVRVPSVPWCGIGLPVRLGLPAITSTLLAFSTTLLTFATLATGCSPQRGVAHDIPPDRQPSGPRKRTSGHSRMDAVAAHGL